MVRVGFWWAVPAARPCAPSEAAARAEFWSSRGACHPPTLFGSIGWRGSVRVRNATQRRDSACEAAALRALT
eukprot:3569528-Lingulodinium_polyedra.AAC.1